MRSSKDGSLPEQLLRPDPPAFGAAAALVAALTLVACSKSRPPRGAGRLVARALEGRAFVRRADVRRRSAGRATVDMPAPKEHIKAGPRPSRASSGGPADLTKTRGEVEVDLTSLSTGDVRRRAGRHPDGPRAHLARGRRRREGLPDALKAQHRFATFAIRSLTTATPKLADVPASTEGADEVRTVDAVAKGELLLHGHKVEREVPLRVELRGKPGAPPDAIVVRTASPFTIVLAEHDVSLPGTTSGSSPRARSTCSGRRSPRRRRSPWRCAPPRNDEVAPPPRVVQSAALSTFSAALARRSTSRTSPSGPFRTIHQEHDHATEPSLENIAGALTVLGTTAILAACGGDSKPAERRWAAPDHGPATETPADGADAGAASCGANKAGGASCGANKGGAASCGAGKTETKAPETTAAAPAAPAAAPAAARGGSGQARGEEASSASCGAGTCSAKK